MLLFSADMHLWKSTFIIMVIIIIIITLLRLVKVDMIAIFIIFFFYDALIHSDVRFPFLVWQAVDLVYFKSFFTLSFLSDDFVTFYLYIRFNDLAILQIISYFIADHIWCLLGVL